MIYEIELPDGRIIEVEGKPGQEEKAIQTVKEYLAKEAVGKSLDEEEFDYETGIQNGFLRAQLDMADTPEEKTGVLQKYVGSDGFVADTRGNIGINKIGQMRLANRGMFDKNLISDKNIVVDESGFSFADFADFGGVVGPLAGAVAALSPHGRLLKLMKNFLGNDRLARSAATALGSAGGQAGEELYETSQRLQQQTIGQQLGEVGVEGILGGVSQGLFEAGGSALHAMLGRKAPIVDINIARAIAQGADPMQLEVLQKSLGRTPTFDDVLKAQKDGTIDTFTTAAVSQRALGRSLAGRTQAASETVFGGAERSKKLIEYGDERLKKFLEKLGDEKLNIDEARQLISSGQLVKGDIDEIIKSAAENSGKTNQELQEYVKNVIEQIDNGAFDLSPNKISVGEKLRQSVQDAYEPLFGGKYDDFGRMIDGTEGKFVAKSRTIDNFLEKNGLDAVMGKVTIAVDDLAKEVEKLTTKNPYLSNLGSVEGVPSSPIATLQKILKDAKDKGLSIEALNEIRGSLLSVKRASGVGAKELGFALNKVDREIKDLFIRLEKGGDFVSMGLKTMPGIDKKEAAKNMSEASKMIREFNKDYAQAVEPFNNIIVTRIRKNARSGGYDVEEIYQHVLKKDRPGYLTKLLDALDETSKVEVKKELQKNVLREAVVNSVDDLGNINPVSFAKFINEKLGVTKKTLFNDIPNFEVVLNDFVKINTRLNAKQFAEVVNRLEMKNFSNVVNKLIDAENTKHLLDADKLLTRITAADPEEIVGVIFRNGQSENVKRIKGLVAADTFEKIQQDSMRSLLQLARGPGKKVDEVFKPEALERALNAKSDAVLNEMFGVETTQALRGLVRDLRIMTKDEGGGAGSLIAGAIAVNAFNFTMFPALLKLGILGQVMRDPRVARRLAKSDKESISIVMEAFKDAIRLAGPLSLTQSVRDTGQEIGGAVEQSLQEFNPEIANTVEQLNKTLQTSQNTPLSNNLDIPNVMPVNPTAQNNQTPISRSLLGGSSLNEDIAQSLGRLA